jgi:hypothetical protein
MHQKNDHHPQRTDERLLSNRQLTRNTVAFLSNRETRHQKATSMRGSQSLPAIMF